MYENQQTDLSGPVRVMQIIVAALIMIVASMLPPAPATNRRLIVLGSRFNKPPIPIPASGTAN